VTCLLVTDGQRRTETSLSQQLIVTAYRNDFYINNTASPAAKAAADHLVLMMSSSFISITIIKLLILTH